MNQIFRPNLARALKKSKTERDAQSAHMRKKTFINTEKPPINNRERTVRDRDSSMASPPREIERKLKDKIEEERHLYDFRYI